jgi:hypothetical protein
MKLDPRVYGFLKVKEPVIVPIPDIAEVKSVLDMNMCFSFQLKAQQSKTGKRVPVGT